VGVSPNRITLLRDADRDGVAETREAFLEGLSQPFGMALLGDTFYVGNTDGVVAFAYATGATRITAPGRKLTEFKPGGHWTRSLLPSPDGSKLYIGVGSLSNIGDNGMEAEEGRACIYELDLASGKSRIFAGGLRNPVGLAWEPQTGVLWTVVNERDGLGDETPPDYLTSVRDGGFYGWPYCYWGKTVDDRVPQDAALVATIGDWSIDLAAHTIQNPASGTVPADSSPPRLTPTEWRILEILLRRPGQLVSSAQLLSGVWGPGFQERTNYLRFHMTRLRRKLEENPSRPRHLLTEPGMGYRYQP